MMTVASLTAALVFRDPSSFGKVFGGQPANITELEKAAAGTKRWRLSMRIRFAREVRLNENGKDRVEARIVF
jgi:hypothetical protein